jgi:flagellar protein FlaG
MEIPKNSGLTAASTGAQSPPDARSVEPSPPSEAVLLTGSKAPQAAPSADQVRDALKQVEQAISTKAQGLRFSLDDETGKTVVRIIDETTQTVLRQIPSEEMLEIAKSLDKMQGLLVKQKA